MTTPPHPDPAGPISGAQLDHVAFGVWKVAAAAELLAGVLGGRPYEGGSGLGFQGGQWRFAGGGVIELIEPVGPPDGFLARFLARRGPGIHHVTFKVPDLRAAAERARALGYEIVGYSDVFPGWKEAFLHPRQAQGIVVQLAEAHPSLDGSWSADWSFPAPPSAPPPPAEIVGLRLSARSAQAAQRQWRALLGGRETREGDALVFRWPHSPLRIAVDVDADAPEGPSALEIATPRDVALPSGVDPTLGARLLRVPGGAARA